MGQTPLDPGSKIVIRERRHEDGNWLTATLETPTSEQEVAQQRFTDEFGVVEHMAAAMFIWTISSAATFHKLPLEFDPPRLERLRA